MHYVQSKINLIQGPTYEEMDGTLEIDNDHLVGKTLQIAEKYVSVMVKPDLISKVYKLCTYS
jgi:hypothetical protein